MEYCCNALIGDRAQNPLLSGTPHLLIIENLLSSSPFAVTPLQFDQFALTHPPLPSPAFTSALPYLLQSYSIFSISLSVIWLMLILVLLS